MPYVPFLKRRFVCSLQRRDTALAGKVKRDDALSVRGDPVRAYLGVQIRMCHLVKRYLQSRQAIA